MALFCISLFFPLLSFIFAAALSHAKRLNFVGLVCSFLILCSATASLMQATIVFDSAPIQILLKDFIWVDGLRLNFGFTIDAVSATMMCVVGVVSTIVHIYSIGYMGKDDGFNRYFSYLGLFVFCMMFLVMSDNFVGLFIGWEGVGLCSWLLIGFWYQRSSANAAANEAFVMNRIADLGILLGMFFIFKEFGSLKFSDVFADAPTVSHQALNFIAAFLFIGAMGKSAQFPFHTWLANAMEGPTPVSALIHAATIVTAGVYLVVRANAIFAQAPEISTFIAYLGAFVAVFAASIALVHNDLKKIIAYSTLSQLGYMFVAAGLGAYWVALFHLMTHAFFKSLLFLGAGNVMHAMRDELDIKKMGGLYKFMKPTAVLMAIGSVALAGFYPFAGFFSKDKILEVAFANGGYILWVVLFAGALMTAFYSFRLLMLVFFGEAKFKFHPHEAKNFMLTAMGVLGVLALISGWFGSDLSLALSSVLPKFELNLEYESEVTLILLTLISITLSTLFTIFAYKKQIFKEELGELKIYKILQNAYFIPKFYERFVIKNYAKAAKFCRKMDEAVIDKSVDGISKLINAFAFNANKMQSGELTRMLRLMVAGFAILLNFIFLLAGGA